MAEAVNTFRRAIAGPVPQRWREAALAALGVATAWGGLTATSPAVALMMTATGAGLLLGLVVMAALRLVARMRETAERQTLARTIRRDAVPCLLTDRAGRVLDTNAAASRILEISPGQLLSTGLAGIFAAPDASMAALIRAAARDGSARADRVSRDGQLRVSALDAPAGLLLWRVENHDPENVTAGVADIALPALVVEPDGGVIAANAAFRSLLGGDPAGQRISAFLSAAARVSGEVCALTTQDGPMQVRLHVVETAESGRQEIYFLPVDIARASGTAQLFDTLPVPMVKVRIDGVVVAANQGACELLGRDVAPGTALAEVLSGLGRSITDWLQDAVSGRTPSRSEFLQVRGREGDRFVQVSLKPVEEGGELAVVAVLTDATELKTLEAQFVQSQKMQAIGQLAGGVAHDFNNLLTAISGHCDLLLLRHDEGDPAYGDLVQINQNANRAAALVGQLLAFSRKQTLSPEIVDLSEVLSDLTHLLSRLVGETVRLSLRHDETVPPIRVDKRQLEQVIMNLVVNARDAMPEGGEIMVETARERLEAEMRRNRAVIPPGEYATIRIRDEGVGIPQENLQKIFEPFYTTKKTGDGTGLGLSTAYGIVKQTGGFIFADSAPGSGTTFTLYFPGYVAEQPARVEAGEGAVESEPVRTGGVVLLVEDEAPVRAFASRALRLRGFTVLEAENAEEALEQLEDADLHVDVFVTDVVMPGMDGPSWVREALKHRPETRVIFVSGYAEDALSDQQARIPNSIFLPKPFSLQQLTRTVQSQLQ